MMLTIIAGSHGVGKTSFAGVVENNSGGVFLKTTLRGSSPELEIKAAKEKGCRVQLLYIALDSAEECLARVRHRAARGGLDVPEDEVLQSFNERWERLMQLLPHCDEAKFFDNGNGFVKVAEYKNEKILFTSGLQPVWLQEMKKYLKI